MIKMQGIIIKIISNICTVKVNDELYECKPRGKFYYQKLTPLVGDNVVIDSKNNYILEILPRKNYLKRPFIANVDECIIVTSLKEPSLSLLLLDKLLCLVIYNKIKPIICFTKKDLLNNEELNNFKVIYDYYNKIGIDIVVNDSLDKLESLIKNKTVVLTGQTGAGKSSLLNRLIPNLDLKTNKISKALSRGVHTTRHTEFYNYHGALIADTPGFSSLDLNDISKEDIRNCFIEFGNNCRFKDCYHINENDCLVKDMVEKKIILKSRYDNYLKILNEISKR